MRTQRLRADLHTLNAAYHGHDGDDSSNRAAAAADRSAKLFATHIAKTTTEKPHLIFAYSWIMYIALFNGGRWIHGQLLSAGAEFWTSRAQAADKEKEDLQSLSFWTFAGDDPDGEDIKADFQRRYDEAASRLTHEEEVEVMEEAVEIFRRQWVSWMSCMRLLNKMLLNESPSFQWLLHRWCDLHIISCLAC